MLVGVGDFGLVSGCEDSLGLAEDFGLAMDKGMKAFGVEPGVGALYEGIEGGPWVAAEW